MHDIAASVASDRFVRDRVSHDLRHVNLGQVDTERAHQLALLRREQRLYRSRIKKLLNTQLLCALKRSAKRLAAC
jgi:hypothetical protein